MTSDFSAEIGAGLPPNIAANALPLTESIPVTSQATLSQSSPAATAPRTPGSGPTSQNHQSGLFGRGLLYVVVFSLQILAATIVSPVLAHLIGPAEFGRLASAIALYQLLTVLAVIGLDQAIVLQRAEDGNNRSARGLLVVSFALTIVVAALLFVTGPLWSRPLGFGYFSPLLMATLLWTVGGAFVQVMLGLLLAEDRLKVFTMVSALAAVGSQVFGIVFIVVGSNAAVTYVWGAVLSQFGALAIGLVATRPRVQGLLDLKTTRKAFVFGVPLAIGNMATFVLNAGDRIVVQRILGASEVGRYQVAYNVGFVVVLLLVFTSQAWTPRFAAIRDRAERLELTGRSRRELYLLLMPMIVGITLGAPLALRIVAPPSFRPESLTLIVFLVALAAFPVASAGTSTRELFILRRGRSIAVATAAAAVFNVALNIVLVPRFGIAGSAATTVLAFTLQAFLLLRAMPKAPPWPKTSVGIWVGIGIVCLTSAASIGLPQTLGWNLARLAVAACCLPWLVVRLSTARTGSVPAWWVRVRGLVSTRGGDRPAVTASEPVSSPADEPPAGSAAVVATAPERGSLLARSVLVLLAMLAVLLVVVDVPGNLRAVVVAAALLLVPGAALRQHDRSADPWAQAGISVALSLTVGTLLALAMIWTQLWHPLLAGVLLLVAAANVLVFRDLRPTSRRLPGVDVPTGDGTAAPAATGLVGRRLVAHLVDVAVPAGVVLLLIVVGSGSSHSVQSAVWGAGVLFVLAWLALGWRLAVTRSASVGLLLAGLRVGDSSDGSSLGWRRGLGRILSTAAIELSIIGLVVQLLDLTKDPARRTWSDLSAGSQVVTDRESTRQALQLARRSAPVVPVRKSVVPPRRQLAPEPEAPATAGPGLVAPGWTATSTDPRWTVTFDSGETLEVRERVMVGRDPGPVTEAESAVLQLPDLTRTVSRRHFALGLDADGIFVIDQGSANGTIVTSADATSRRCDRGERTRVADGDIVSFGEHWLEVTREPRP